MLPVNILLGTVLLCTVSLQAASLSKCTPTAQNTEICSVDIDFSGQNKKYVYEIKRAQPGRPTVVEIPGGPGQGYIGGIEANNSSWLIPNDYGVIAIDPRGVGQNDYGQDLIGGNYSSDLIAADIVKILEQENMTSYMIHGQSFGTVVATKIANLINHNVHLTLPKAIILSGVVNQFYDNQLDGYNEQLARILEKYTETQKNNIRSGLTKILTETFNGQDLLFANSIVSVLLINIETEDSILGQFAPNFKKFFDRLAYEQSLENDPVFNFLVSSSKDTSHSPGQILEIKRKNTMAEEIKCRELSGAGPESTAVLDLVNFKFNIVSLDCSIMGYQLDKPYQSIEHQISNIPVYYFQGSIDPATTPAGAYEHYKNQSTDQKLYIEISGYAHWGLLGMSNCRTGLWESLAVSTNEFRSIIGQCNDSNINLKN